MFLFIDNIVHNILINLAGVSIRNTSNCTFGWTKSIMVWCNSLANTHRDARVLLSSSVKIAMFGWKYHFIDTSSTDMTPVAPCLMIVFSCDLFSLTCLSVFCHYQDNTFNQNSISSSLDGPAKRLTIPRLSPVCFGEQLNRTSHELRQRSGLWTAVIPRKWLIRYSEYGNAFLDAKFRSCNSFTVKKLALLKCS